MKTAIVLSYESKRDGSLKDQGAERVARSAQLYKKGQVEKIVMTGGWRLDLNNKSDAPTHAKVMAAYAVSLGVSPEDIFQEEQSVDTVGQLILTKRDILVPENLQDIIIVTHKYHLPRVSKIAKVVFGPEYAVSYEGIEKKLLAPGVRDNERRSLQAFFRTFEGVASGDTGGLVDRLYEAHPLYAGH